MPKPSYSLAAHLIHSGLQLIWKRLKITTEMDHIDLMNANIGLFNQVAKAMERKYGIKSDRPDYGQAAYMLIETFLQSEPLYRWFVVHTGINNRTSRVVFDSETKTYIPDGYSVVMSESQAHEMLIEIQSFYPKERFHLQKRWWKGVG